MHHARSLTALLLTVLTLLAASACASTTPGTGSVPAASEDGAFPVTMTHRFGTTTIEARPQRVVTVGFNDQDFALAVGVEPVGVREFLGYPAPDRPWAPEGVRGKQLPTVGSQDLDLEAIAKLEPDLILGINSYIDDEAYGLLSGIAPTVAQTADYPEGATPWDKQTEQTGQALGRSEQATKIIAETRAAFDAAIAEHPEFEGKRAVFLLGSSAAGFYNLGADDYRTGWLTELGFDVDAKGGEISYEKLDTLDRDVLLGEGIAEADFKRDLVQQLTVVKEGRYVGLGAFDDDFAAALGFNSPLSLPFLLDIAVPRLAAATDGDPATTPAPYLG
ncbi:ABC transporter substrate-binding protein [Microlunatus parietis]|uniref:Iron complex transport system substrate-binding protein n=1 Tax=Microlunatus parietis TaxID=682979 RepID=A0A7Y9LBY9_9ACTN|nr:ABC transporter substrate-binding protein [Microlunatus parietis]NYE70306.1 iron complex transport system substrate-binding protein [Microlunatus parietis]